jgi:mono/diheme cytochrome c family protein
MREREKTMPLTNYYRATIRLRPGVATNLWRTGLLGLLVGCGLLSAAPTSARAADAGSSRGRLAQQLFARYCSQCHGTDGRGVAGRVNAPAIPDFTDRTWQHSRTNVQLVISVLEGRNQMQPNRGIVSDDMARDLVALVRTFAPEPARAEVPLPKPAPAPAVTTPVVTAPGVTTPAVTTLPYTPTGEFEVDIDSLSKQFDDLQRQAQELDALAAAKRTAPAVSPPGNNPPASASPVAPVPTEPSVAPSVASNPPPTNPVAVSPPAPVPPISVPQAGRMDSAPEKSPIAAVPVSDRPLTVDDVARGQELFLGRRALVNGGPACVACHAVNHGEARDGGRLGPDLTKAYKRLGEREGLSGFLWAPASRKMHTTYLQHGLESDEVLSLVAYLEDADRLVAAGTSPMPLQSLLVAAGGTVLGLAAFGALWGSRSRRRNLSPSPGDFVGAGL